MGNNGVRRNQLGDHGGSLRLLPVEPGLTWKIWPLIEEWVCAAVFKGRGNMEPKEIKERLVDNTMRLWLVWDGNTRTAIGCCIAEITNGVRGRGLNLVVVSGRDLANWWHLVKDVKAFARERGCVRLESSSRAGMVVLLKADGWRELHTVMELRLDADG